MSIANEPADTGASATKPEEALSRIAELLGCSVDDFAIDVQHGEMAQASELLRLWCAIDSREDRNELLEMARALASA